jgi:hypothetical protein
VKSIIRNFSAPTEFLLVIFITFGLTVASCLVWITNQLYRIPRTPGSGVELLSNQRIIEAVVFQLLTLGLALWIGRIRGWSLATFGFRPSWKWTGAGVILFGAFLLIQHVIGFLSREVFHTGADFHRVSQLTLPFVILISVVNPVFEETIECGYFFQALQRHGMWLTVLASAAFRGFLHSTMGVSGFVSMFAEGLLHGFFYWRCRQLWPLIVAHALQMLCSLLPQALAA